MLLQAVYALELSHLQAMVVFAFFTTLVFTFLSREGWRERLKYFGWTFFLFVAIGVGLGWLMFPFPR
jgi:amino acid permease